MLKSIRFLPVLWVMLAVVPVMAADSLLDKMDALNKAGGVENQKKAIDLGLKAVKANPDSYEANWKLSRSYAYYTHTLQKHLVPGWEEDCKTYAKKGMQYAEKAMSLEPEKIDGHYFFAFNAGMYSYGVSIFGAITEGLKGKTQRNFEKVYQMNKNYEKGAVMVSLARFWHKLPWPLKDEKKALELYREYQQTPFYGKDPGCMVVMAELLADMGGKKREQEAKQILEQAMNDEDCGEYYLQIGREVLQDLD